MIIAFPCAKTNVSGTHHFVSIACQRSSDNQTTAVGSFQTNCWQRISVANEAVDCIDHLETTPAVLSGSDVHLGLPWFSGFPPLACLRSREVRVALPGCRPAGCGKVTHPIRAVPFEMPILLAVETPTNPLWRPRLRLTRWSSQLRGLCRSWRFFAHGEPVCNGSLENRRFVVPSPERTASTFGGLCEFGGFRSI
ncbi:hypothetical protein T06_13197 [Trichinella sp. T6]|nr:hypothetical protein T06_13197 [Trichinella sp. T6]